jgi:hypothetical protein
MDEPGCTERVQKFESKVEQNYHISIGKGVLKQTYKLKNIKCVPNSKRYQSGKARSKRLLNSVYPQTISLLNS